MASERQKITAGKMVYTAVWILIWPVAAAVAGGGLAVAGGLDI